MTPSLSTLLDVAIESAYLAGRRALAYFNTGIPVELKRDRTPVTQADRECEQLIRARIAKSFPTHSILGEEHGATDGDPDYRWIIDPIDGTKTFICGVPFFGVLIGVEVKGKPSVGVIYMPALDEMVSAATGLGCRWNGRPAHVSNIADLSESAVMVTDVAMMTARSDVYQRLQSTTRFQRTWGDCYGYILVATGRAEAMFDPEMKPWDCAPLLPILEEAGGHFTNWQGAPTIWGPDGFASNAALYQPFMDILKSERRA